MCDWQELKALLFLLFDFFSEIQIFCYFSKLFKWADGGKPNFNSAIIKHHMHFR